MSNSLTLHAPDGKPFLEYRRDFEFPVGEVFNCHTDPDLYARWVGPWDVDTRIDMFDARPGGAYRFVHSRGEEAYAFRGIFHTVRQDEFLLQTFEFEGYPDVVTLEYTTFTELPGGRSSLSGRSLYPSVESRDQFVSNGIEDGMSAGFNQLDELLGSVRVQG